MMIPQQEFARGERRRTRGNREISGLSSSRARGVQPISLFRACADALAAGADALEERLERERHQLPLFIPVFLGIGIAMWFSLPDLTSWIAAMLTGLAAAMGGVAIGGRTGRCLTVGGLLVAAGVLLAWVHAQGAATPVLKEERFGIPLRAEIVTVEDLQARGRTRVLLAPRSQLPADMRVRISLRGELPPGAGPGALIAIRATVSPPPGPSVPGGYHFARRAWFEGIGATGYALGAPEILRPAQAPRGFRARLDALRTAITRYLQQSVSGRAGGVAAALVTGDRGGIAPEVTESMRDSGLAHLIAISGLHIAVVVGGIFWIVRRLLTLWPWFALHYDARLAASLAGAAAGVAYTLVAGASVPTVRACIAVLIVLFGLAVGREALSLRLVAVGATLILLWRPDFLLSPSFQLSFAAVTGIVALYQSRPGRRWSEARRQGGPLGRAGRGVAALFLTGIVAELTLGGIALYHFNQMGFYGAAANLLAIPLTSFVIIPLLILALLCAPLGLAGPALAGLGLSIEALIVIAERTAALPGAVALMPGMPDAAFALIVLGGLWLCLWQTGWRWFGLVGPLIAAALILTAPRPDIFVAPDGSHLAIVTDDRIYMLRPRAGDYITEMWSSAAGARMADPLDTMPGADCTADACTVALRAEGRVWRILATRSRNLIEMDVMRPLCSASDIVVSDRYLPNWCRGRWLTLDARTLSTTGAVAVDLDHARLRSRAGADGEHPWAL
ncbi:ComEC/Rec2 family competence protein [Pacificimonas flava]|uniref:ComEC/Rec2-related protein n=2 Tax=Pacificimonas flava TaxID=1234595 RepID=M2TDK9_9SPHN|nr:ComEC/Rec2 family competence protein [Pacificimonas flava]EMD84594.1 ComEC/Rec2-related protein [Pacificimonas flava]